MVHVDVSGPRNGHAAVVFGVEREVRDDEPHAEAERADRGCGHGLEDFQLGWPDVNGDLGRHRRAEGRVVVVPQLDAQGVVARSEGRVEPGRGRRTKEAAPFIHVDVPMARDVGSTVVLHIQDESGDRHGDPESPITDRRVVRGGQD